MKKLVMILSAAIILSACGEGGLEEVKIDTKDVKGAIAAGDATIDNTELHNEDGVFDVPIVKFGKNCRMMIVPTNKTFDETWERILNSATNFKSEIKEIEKKDGAVFYEEKSEFMEKKTEGFGFLVVIKGKDKNYLIKGEGENPFAPITSKEDAEKAFKAAQTFKPE